MAVIKDLLKYKLRHNVLLNKKIKHIDKLLENSNFESHKNKEFIRFFESSVKNNTFYKRYYAEHGINLNSIKNIDDLKSLPTITKIDVKQNSNELKNTRLPLFKGYTSGTTGTPLVIYRDLKAIISENAYVWWYRLKMGLNPKDPKVSVRGDLNKDKLFYFDKASNTLHISSFNINKKNANAIYKKIADFNPKALIGYPSSLSLLASLNTKNHINIPLCFTSSEKLYPHQEKYIQQVFSSEIFDWFGNSERTVALYREDKKYFEPPLYSINKYEEDCVITTSLINSVFPLVNYQVEDKMVSNNIYSQEKKSVIIESIEGRSESYIVLPDGSRVGSAALSLIFKDMDILNSQIIQNDTQSLTFNVVPGKGFNDKEKLLSHIRSKLGDQINVEVAYITEKDIILSKSGKYNLVKSQIQ